MVFVFITHEYYKIGMANSVCRLSSCAITYVDKFTFITFCSK